MVIDLRKDNANSRVLARSQVTGHDVGLVVETLGTIAHQYLSRFADIRMVLQGTTDRGNRYP